MEIVEPAQCVVSLSDGTLTSRTGRYEKRLSDLAGLYEDAAALDAIATSTCDAVAYEVNEFRSSNASGDMVFGVTRMAAGRVGAEYFMTRGHVHVPADRPEIYYGQRGRELMQMESPDGETRIVEIDPQTICYVPPHWIHRSINIGAHDLVMVFSYPADSGQDYAIIERSGGLRHRVVATAGGGWALAENKAIGRAPRMRLIASAELLFLNAILKGFT